MSEGRRMKQNKNEHSAWLSMVVACKALGLLCGCFASSGTGNLQHVEGKMDSFKYQEIWHAVSEESEAWASLDLPTGQ